jgi:DNA-directed RNA polymerase subunit L
MKIEIIEETNTKLKFKMLNSRHTVPEMLKKQLLTHKEVTMASGMLKHPEDKDSEFILVVKNADPKAILIKAIDELQKEVLSFKDEMLKAIPSEKKTKK